MPINFELTFTQPFLAQLDTGQPKGSKDMAKFITDNYVRTLLTGIPGGGSVPPVLPAPALGSPPPPFPIPSVPINAFSNRKRAMQRILQTYFEAREILIMKGTIKSLIKSIALLVKKAFTLQKQIEQLINQAVAIQRQLAELPILLEQIADAIIQVIENEKEQLDSIFFQMDRFELELGQVQFRQTFSQELQLIESIKNFKPTLNIASYESLFTILDTSAAFIGSLPDGQDGNDIQMFKRRLYEQIKSSVSLILNISAVFTKPEQVIGYIQGLAEVDYKLKPVLDILYRYQFIRRKLEPQLIKLKKKVREKIDKVKAKIKQKIAEEKKKLKDWMKKLAEKRQGAGKKNTFLKAGKIISDFKKNYLAKIKTIKKTVTGVRTVVATAQRLIKDTSELKRDIDEFGETGLQNYLDKFASGAVNSLTPAANASYVEEELNKLYRSIGLNNPILIDAINRQFVGKVSSPLPLLDYLASRPADLLSITQRFQTILSDVEYLIKAVQDLTSKKRVPPKRGFIGPPNFTPPTVGETMIALINRVQLELSKIEKKLREFASKQTQRLKKILNKIKQDVKMKLLVLVPIKSDLKDGKTKAEILQLKKDKIKDTKDKIKRTIKKIAIINSKIIPGATNLAKNLTAGNWRYSANQVWLGKLVDGVFDLKILNNPAQQKDLNERRKKIKADFTDYLFGFELLVDLIIKIANQMESTDFLKVFGDRLKQRTVQGYIDFYNKIESIKNLKNADIKEVISFFSSFFTDPGGFRVLEGTYIRTVLSDCERQYFNESRAFLQQFGQNPLLQRIFPGIDVQLDIMLVTIFENVNKLAIKIRTLLEKLYKLAVKPLIDWVQEKLKKIKDDIKAWLNEHVVKRALNLDLKLMSLAFNLATRAFWTGFSWTTPNGVRYTALNIGPFLPLITKPDAGASALVRELSRNLNNQLLLMNGLVSPPPPTGIPPFPFVGYR